MKRELRAANGQFAGSTAGAHPPTVVPQTPAAPRLRLAHSVPGGRPARAETVPSLAWPQADELDKVGAVVVAVNEGADTANAIAESLGVVSRQGSYYASAAESLGIITRDGQYVPCRWRLTEFGEALKCADPGERSALMFAAVENHPAVQTYMDGGESAVIAAAEGQGLSAETGARRAQTAKAWAERATSGDSAPLTREMAAAAARAPEVASRLRAERAARQAAPREVCDVCFMEKSVTGVCFC